MKLVKFLRTPPVASFETKHMFLFCFLLNIRIGNPDWNESYEEKLNISMLQLRIYYILEQEI